jgi:hypothetical protein
MPRREHWCPRLIAYHGQYGNGIPTTICLIGSSPCILRGQPDRQSADIDIWRPASAYDETDLRRACQELGILFDSKGELDPDAIYLQVVAPGIVKLPEDLPVDILGQYGALTVATPAPALLSAAKLARGEPRDVEDVAWWIKEQALDLSDIRAAIGYNPRAVRVMSASLWLEQAARRRRCSPEHSRAASHPARPRQANKRSFDPLQTSLSIERKPALL